MSSSDGNCKRLMITSVRQVVIVPRTTLQLLEGMPVIAKTTKRSVKTGLIRGTTEERRGIIIGVGLNQYRVKLHPRTQGQLQNGEALKYMPNSDVQLFPKSALRPDLSNRVCVSGLWPTPSAAFLAGIRRGDIIVGVSDADEQFQRGARQEHDDSSSNSNPFSRVRYQSQDPGSVSVRPVVALRSSAFMEQNKSASQMIEASDLGPQTLQSYGATETRKPALLVLRKRKYRVL